MATGKTMEFGRVEYTIQNPESGSGARTLKLTLIGQGDEDTLERLGLAALRRRRIIRLANEARLQGTLLGYEDLSALLLTSLATLKRDITLIEQSGEAVPLKGRRKNGNGLDKVTYGEI
jgi:hypothetical protein